MFDIDFLLCVSHRCMSQKVIEGSLRVALFIDGYVSQLIGQNSLMAGLLHVWLKERRPKTSIP
ncbi:hypothetical protein [Hafnia psychrotolerans]|jgi:hypothetical protein|uniref:hypothetical protein n=1 Tax=Hafnia psychrotolerans TaxID=1477018 RepID=UPI00166CB038|nr:hypothetical protein [Hafnia psychrotolerans]